MKTKDKHAAEEGKKMKKKEDEDEKEEKQEDEIGKVVHTCKQVNWHYFY